MDNKKEATIINLGEFIIDNDEDEKIFKRYLTERFINGNEMYRPPGLKQVKKEKIEHIEMQ